MKRKHAGIPSHLEHHERVKGKGQLRDGDPKHWIKGAIKHPGALHRQLHVPVGKKIPTAKLRAAAKKGGKLGARARVAQTLKRMH